MTLFKVLITWWEIPDEVFFIPVEVCEEKANLLVGFHGKFINSVADKDIAKQMCEYFYDEEGNFKFMSKRTKNMLCHEKFDYVVLTGIHI